MRKSWPMVWCLQSPRQQATSVHLAGKYDLPGVPIEIENVHVASYSVV